MGNLDTEAFLKALRSVYEAALEPELWPDVVNSIADMINAESTHLMVVDAKTGGDVLGFLERQDPAAHAEYLEHYFEHDIRVPRLAAARAGEILRDRDVWTEEERLSSPLYHDYQRVHRLYEITGAPLGVDGHLTWLGFSRNRPSPFEDDAEGIIKLMVPHFRQAVRIALEVGNARIRTDALGQLWSDSGRGVLILAPDGKVAFSNVEAQSMCQRRLIRLTADKLSFREGGLNKLLAINISALRDGRSPPATAAAGVAAA
ncbi:MAG TPA: hypothetical protein VFQ34_06275, partial [Nitrospiraceae bacterium]|nr:hypothetical protein [Nitrospiraceae bacterium]